MPTACCSHIWASASSGFASTPQAIDELKATEPQVPWRELAGFRNVIVHSYLGVDVAAVWLVVEQDLPPLAAAVARMVARTCDED